MGQLPRIVLALLLLSVTSAFSQTPTWEIGGAGGYALGKDNSVVSSTGQTGDAGLQRGFLASAVAVDHMFEHLSGEFRYVYRKGNPFVKTCCDAARMTGEAHSVGYDLLLQINGKEERIRPYIAFGGGVKVFRGTGGETDYQPLQNLVVLSKTQQTEPMFSIGGGVSIRLAPYAVFRVDFRDQVTPFPKKVIFPAPGSELTGFFHDFLPMAGVSWSF